MSDTRNLKQAIRELLAESNRDIFLAKEVADKMGEQSVRLVGKALAREEGVSHGSGRYVRWGGIISTFWILRNADRYRTAKDESRHLRLFSPPKTDERYGGKESRKTVIGSPQWVYEEKRRRARENLDGVYKA